MTSKEDISLQLTKAIIENSGVSKTEDPATVIAHIYNDIYQNIKTANH